MHRPLLHRIFLSALLFDGSFYMVGTIVPLKAVSLGASAFELGLMPVLGAGSYVVAALIGGNLADRWPRVTMARWGSFLRALVTLLLFLADSTGRLLAVLPLFGLVNGLFWPGIQAVLPSLAGPRELGGLIGRFNVSWSAGKMIGFAVGGVLIDRIGYGLPIWLATIAGGLPAWILPGERRLARSTKPSRSQGSERAPAGSRTEEQGGREADGLPGPESGPGPTPAVPQPPVEPPVRTLPVSGESQPNAAIASVWRRIGWTSNFLLFGVGATLNYHYPKLLDTHGLGGTEFGVFLGLAYFVQTLAFLVFGRWGGWHYRARWLLGAELLVAAALLLLPHLTSPWAIWALAPAIGVGLGLAYTSSLFYSLLGPGAHGRSTGLHEAILASGSFLLPFLAGLAVRASGDLRFPYPLAAVVVIVGAAAQWAWIRSARREFQASVPVERNR